jgi:hypothetical protein
VPKARDPHRILQPTQRQCESVQCCLNARPTLERPPHLLQKCEEACYLYAQCQVGTIFNVRVHSFVLHWSTTNLTPAPVALVAAPPTFILSFSPQMPSTLLTMDKALPNSSTASILIKPVISPTCIPRHLRLPSRVIRGSVQVCVEIVQQGIE